MTHEISDALRSDEYKRNPFPVWRRLREQHPLYYDEPANRWILSRYEDVVSVLSDYKTYSTRTYRQRFRPVFGRTLAELDGRKHVRERTIVAPAFVGRNLRAYRPLIESSVADLHAEIAGRDRLDLVEVTNRLPLTVIASLLGFRREDFDVLLDIGNEILEGLEDDHLKRARGRSAHLRLSELLKPMVKERREKPSSDLISKITHGEADGEQLSDQEIYSFVSFLLVAGGPTTDMAIRNFWWALLERPDEMRRCAEDSQRLDRAFSESLRRDGPIVYEDRRTNQPVEWYGKEIAEDANILVCLGAANTDDSVFSDPETFNPDRTDLLMGTERRTGYREDGVAGHLAFGLGNHFCMGYQLARVEALIATEKILLRLGEPRLSEPRAPRITWYERRIESLPVITGRSTL